VIDAAASGCQVFQITASSDHSLCAVGTEKLLQSAGFIDAGGRRTEKCKKTEKMKFYWLVLPAHFPDWCKKAPILCTSNNSEVRLCWNNNVVQYALELSMAGPEPRVLSSTPIVSQTAKNTAQSIGNIESTAQIGTLGTPPVDQVRIVSVPAVVSVQAITTKKRPMEESANNLQEKEPPTDK
jgi:hypothetical protein